MKQELQIFFMGDKPKQIKAHIYPEIYEELIKIEDFKHHGLTYALNAELARRYGLELPATPKSKMSAAGKKAGPTKNPHLIEIVPDWYDLLGALIKNETWYRKDYPSFSTVAEIAGLVNFVKRHGGVATEDLKRIWEKSDRRRKLQELLQTRAEEKGYVLEFDGPTT